MKDKEKLKRLVQIIGDLLEVEGNEWLLDELLQIIGKVSPVEEIAKRSLIQNIHEYCVEQKIDKQAKEFYASFPIAEIKDQLILDYKKMEHERRRDDFENFCLCMYQQIESITNFLFDKKIKSEWNSKKNQIVVEPSNDKAQNKFEEPNAVGTSLEQLVFDGQDNPQWFANRKFRAVLYFFYFKKNVLKNDYPFNLVVRTFDEIYQTRNQNHRGSTPSPYVQKWILNKIKGNESRYYFKFYGFLQDFVNKIESSYSSTSNSGNKSNKPIKYKPEKNTIEANHPESEKLKQQMKKNE